MRRSTTYAVLGAAGVLIAAGQMPRMPWERWIASVPLLLPRWEMPSLERVRIAAPRVDLAEARAMVPAWNPVGTLEYLGRELGPFLNGPLPYVLVGAVGGVALLYLLSRIAPSGDPRQRVLRLARMGRPVAGIARSARLPQDTVRALLSPGMQASRLPL